MLANSCFNDFCQQWFDYHRSERDDLIRFFQKRRYTRCLRLYDRKYLFFFKSEQIGGKGMSGIFSYWFLEGNMIQINATASWVNRRARLYDYFGQIQQNATPEWVKSYILSKSVDSRETFPRRAGILTLHSRRLWNNWMQTKKTFKTWCFRGRKYIFFEWKWLTLKVLIHRIWKSQNGQTIPQLRCRAESFLSMNLFPCRASLIRWYHSLFPGFPDFGPKRFFSSFSEGSVIIMEVTSFDPKYSYTDGKYWQHY